MEVFEGVTHLETGQDGNVVFVGRASKHNRRDTQMITSAPWWGPLPFATGSRLGSRIMVGEIVLVENRIARPQPRADPFHRFLS